MRADRLAILHKVSYHDRKMSLKRRRLKSFCSLTRRAKSRACNRFELTCEPLCTLWASEGDEYSVAQSIREGRDWCSELFCGQGEAIRFGISIGSAINLLKCVSLSIIKLTLLFI